MPPSIYYELSHFAEEAKIPLKLRNVIQQQAPKKNELKVPGIFIYTLVDTMRDRIDRGLRLAERHVREALSSSAKASEDVSTQSLAKGDATKKHGEIRADAEAIGRLRETYRRIMREGALDSKADVDLLLLSYELDGFLVTADEGVLLWAEHLGLKILPYPQLKSLLEK
jgi:RNA ligase partner protein